MENLLQCACKTCLCVVNAAKALEKNEHYYCSEACASGHTIGQGCGHKGCKCS